MPVDSSSLDNTACPVGNARCYCTNRNLSMYSENRTNCRSYYVCSETEAMYVHCRDNLSPLPSHSPLPPTPPPVPAEDKPAYSYGVYVDSRGDPWVGEAADSKLGKFPKYVTHLFLAFMQPDTTYTGGVTFEGTGLRFASDATVVKDAIVLLKKKNPHTKVLISVGGFMYNNWNDLNATAIANFVYTFGLDGVDIGYEPMRSNCKLVDSTTQCETDWEYTYAIKALRAAMPRPYILANAAMNVGAYGEGKWADAQPTASDRFRAISIPPLRKLGHELDALLLVAYDAGETFDPKEAFTAYSSYFEGDVLVGVQVPPESWGGHEVTLLEIDNLTVFLRHRNAAGMFLFDAFRRGPHKALTANQISKRICMNLGLDDCETPLVSW
ncbi:hypothetical protein H632_c1418p0 [Helicosporidium sp. ATCC 50920]|nr:hypothetical protein H632_c1418p0 [Helicosporidium sp. ATCC 50920]|eukprot:KDD74301.1 hypothetical protein H632_c1418p0 [Helicosporidium sp. ATCC 50920]